jgi:hypothetical protein
MKRFSKSVLKLTAVCALATACLTTLSHADDNTQTPPGGGAAGGAGGRQNGPQAGFHLIPHFAEAKLKLTDDQKTAVAALEKETKAKLAKILTADQMKTLETSRPTPPGGGQGGQAQGQGGQDGPPGGGGGGGDQGGPPGAPPQ